MEQVPRQPADQEALRVPVAPPGGMAASETTAETGTVPETTAERRVPPAGATVRRAKTEDFAFLSRLPARKPEIFDRDAINRAALLVGGLALGLWVVMIIARPGTPPESEPIPESFIQEAPPITSTGNGLAPAPQELAPPPEVISLTPAPSWTPPPPAPEQPPAMQAPAMRAPAAQPPAIQPGAVNGYPDAGIEEVAPSVADTPDPSNLFSTP